MNYKITVFIFIFLCLTIWSNSILANISDGLVGYWPLDGNGKDESGNGNDAELEAGADWVKDGWVNDALMTDGEGGHAVVDTAFKLVTLEITVVARINGWRTIPWSGIVVGRSPTTFWMGVADNDTLTYVWNDNKAETWGWKGAPAVPENKWALVAIAIEKDKATSYIYHRDSGKLDSAENKIPHIEQTVMNLKFGWDDCCGARYWKGIIDEVMVFDRTLSADEIEQLAAQGLAVDNKGKLSTTWATLKHK
ncbi:LamG domain-containing protein [Candidatus Poribacteria bacterium]|nr:LamG domain-containing protein [Candidatus Poribacteria bacterium]